MRDNCVLNVDKSAIIVLPTVNSVVLPMELDTRSAISMIPVDVYQSKFANCQLQPSNKVLCSFTGESVPCKGMFKVNVQYNSHNVDLVLYVVRDSRHILFGRGWLEATRLDWSEIKFRSESGSVCLSHDCQLDGLVSKHQDLFDGQLGLLKGINAHVYTKPYWVPYALRPKVELELG